MLRRRWATGVLVLVAIGAWQVVASLPGVDHLTLAAHDACREVDF